MKAGTFKTLSADDFMKMKAKSFEYGIYRVRIESDGHVNTKKNVQVQQKQSLY